jgi:hypothetical protein
LRVADERIGAEAAKAMAAIAKLKLLASRKAADRPSDIAPPAAADEDELPIRSDIKAVFLGGLFLFAMLAAC